MHQERIYYKIEKGLLKQLSITQGLLKLRVKMKKLKDQVHRIFYPKLTINSLQI